MWILLRVILDFILFAVVVISISLITRNPLRKYILNPSGITSFIPRTSLETTLSLSLSLYTLVFAGISGILHQSSLHLLWHIILFLILFLLLVVLPITQFYSLLPQRKTSKFFQIFFVMFSETLWLYLFWHIESDEDKSDSIFEVRSWVSRLASIGVPIIALLSGYGAISTPYKLSLLFIRPIEDGTIQVLEKQLRDNEHFIELKKDQLHSLAIHSSSQSSSSSSSSSLIKPSKIFGFIQNRFGSNNSNSHSNENEEEILLDIEALETFGRELRKEITSFKQENKKSVHSKTFIGQIEKLTGFLLGLFCIYRILSAITLLLFGLRNGIDPITRIIGYVIWIFSFGFGDSNVDSTFWSQQLSLAFAGFLAFLSLRGLLLQIRKAFGEFNQANIDIKDEDLTLLSGIHKTAKFTQNTSKTVGKVHGLLAIATAQIAGAYFISSILLMRKSLPTDYRRPINDAVGNIDFDSFHLWFDVFFLISSFFTALVIIAQEVISHKSKSAH